MEQHWKVIKEGLYPIAYSFFVVTDKASRKPWASDEFAALKNTGSDGQFRHLAQPESDGGVQ